MMVVGETLVSAETSLRKQPNEIIEEKWCFFLKMNSYVEFLWMSEEFDHYFVYVFHLKKFW